MKQILRIPRHLNAPQELILVRLLVTLGAAGIVATSSLYLRSLGLSDAVIGLSTAIVMFVNLVFALLLPKLLRRFDLVKLLIFSTAGLSLTLLLFGSVQLALVALGFYILGRLLLSLFASAYSILFHDDAAGPKDFKKNQALSGSMTNFAWMSMPFFATLVIGQYSFATLYVLGAGIAFCATILLLITNIPEKKKRQRPPVSIFTNIRTYFSQKRLRDVYIISTGVDMWWVFIFVFVTLFMKDAGFSTTQVGLYLTLGQLPLFLFEFKTNKLVERYNYRSPVINSYSFMAFAMLITGLVGINLFTLGVLTFSSLFIVFLEPAREMYLYEKMKPSDEERMQPVYATAELFGSILIRFTIGLLLVWANQTAAFIVMATIFAAIAWHNRTLEE